MLVDPGDIGLTLDTQYFAPLAFRPAVFLAFRRSLGKRRNIPSGERVNLDLTFVSRARCGV
jgi:hypothetical protein